MNSFVCPEWLSTLVISLLSFCCIALIFAFILLILSSVVVSILSIPSKFREFKRCLKEYRDDLNKGKKVGD